MLKNCFICKTCDFLQAHSCSEHTTISGRPIIEIISEILRKYNSEFVICQECYDIVDEIDALEQSLIKAKEKLILKHEKCEKCEFKSESDYFGDAERFLKKVKFKKKDENSEIVNEMEEDFKTLFLLTIPVLT